jgi:hypothetical protein
MLEYQPLTGRRNPERHLLEVLFCLHSQMLKSYSDRNLVGSAAEASISKISSENVPLFFTSKSWAQLFNKGVMGLVD